MGCQEHVHKLGYRTNQNIQKSYLNLERLTGHPKWESYRALFSYIGFEQMNLSQILKEEEKEIDKKEASRSRWLKYFGTSVAAAAIIAFLIVGIQKIAQPQPECYAVIDGKVYTDQEFVHNEALDALEDVSADSEDPFSALDMMKQ